MRKIRQKDFQDDTLILPSGREILANAGIVGMKAFGEVEGELYGGYDDQMNNYHRGDHELISAEDRIALAEHMIERWRGVREHAHSEIAKRPRT